MRSSVVRRCSISNGLACAGLCFSRLIAESMLYASFYRVSSLPSSLTMPCDSRSLAEQREVKYRRDGKEQRVSEFALSDLKAGTHARTHASSPRPRVGLRRVQHLRRSFGVYVFAGGGEGGGLNIHSCTHAEADRQAGAHPATRVCVQRATGRG